MAEILLGVAVFVLFIYMFSRCTKPEEEDYYTPQEKTDLGGEDAELIELINNHRDSLGLSRLKSEVLAYEVCKSHPLYMKLQNKISHDFAQQRHVDSKALESGENVAKGYTTARGRFNGYLASAKHRQTLENPKWKWVTSCTDENYNIVMFLKYKE